MSDPTTHNLQAGAPGLQVHGTRSQALWTATLGFFGGFAGVSIFGPLVPRFTELLDLSPLAAGLLGAIPSLTGSLLRIPFGAMVDRSGGRRPFLTLLLITNLGMAGLLALLATRYPDDMAGTYPLLLVLGALIGCGIATFSVGIAQVSYWFPRAAQGGPLGIYAGLGNTSPGISTLLLPLALGSLGMLGSYAVWFAILIAMSLLYLFLAHDAPWFQARRAGVVLPGGEALAALGGGDVAPSGSATGGLREAAGIPATWVLVYFYFLSFGGFLALTTWLPTYWTQLYDAPLRQAGVLTAVFSLLAAVVRAGGGVLSDRLSIRYALVGNFVLMLAGLVALSVTTSFGWALSATLVVAVGMGLQNAIVFKLLPSYVPASVGGASGWIGGLGALGGFVLPPLIGAVTGAVGGDVGYARGFLPVAVLVVLAFPLVVWLGRRSSPAATRS